MTYKICCKCKVEKDLGEFNKDASRRDGLDRYCRHCKKEKDRAWRVANPEKFKASVAKWRAENRESNRVSRRNWTRHNPLSPSSLEGRKRSLANLDDLAVKRTLRGVSNPPQELIELKRLHMQIKRQIKQGN